MASAVADHRGPRSREEGQTVERGLGAQLLDDADEGIGDQHPAEQRILGRRHHDDHRQERSEEEIEQREDVGPNDLGNGATRAGGHPVDRTCSDPLAHLGGAEAVECFAADGGHLFPQPRLATEPVLLSWCANRARASQVWECQ